MTRDILLLVFLLNACSTPENPAHAAAGSANSASSGGAGGRVAATVSGGTAGFSHEAEPSAGAATVTPADAAITPADAAITPTDAAVTLDAMDSDATAPAPFDAASCSATAPPEAAAVAQALAQALSLTADKVQIACVEEVSWPSGCLGLPAPELCAPGPIPGYVITLRALDTYYVYHTTKKGGWLYAGPGDQPRAP